MTKNDINRRYIEMRLSKVTEAYKLNYSLLEEVRKMMEEAYIRGLEQKINEDLVLRLLKK